MLDLLIRLQKYVASFFKTRWALRDYPIKVREFKNLPEMPPGSRLRPVRWLAHIIGRETVQGTGDTREAALAQLAESFDRSVEPGEARPGEAVRGWSFAPTDRLEAVEHLAPHFFEHVFGHPYEDCIITDQSTLWHFHGRQDCELEFARIEEVYGIDVRDISSGVIVEILERIQRAAPSSGPSA